MQQLDFEFVLFASAVIDYDYIMSLIAKYSQQEPGKQKMNREQLIGLIQADAKFMDEREDIAEYIKTLEAGKGLDEGTVRAGYERFKERKNARELATIAEKHGVEPGPCSLLWMLFSGAWFLTGIFSGICLPPEAGLEGTHAERTGADGGYDTPVQETRPGAGNFGVERL